MKRFLTTHRKDLSVFGIFLYMFFMLFSFDSFCFDTVTTETPLIKLGELPLLRLDFITLLFSLTAVIGAIIGTVMRTKNKQYSAAPVTALGCIALILVIFDVDMLQILVPDMRISHVVMTLSRLSAIIVGASGIFAGLALPLLSCDKHPKAILCGALAALLFSLLASVEKLYTLSFSAIALILIIIGISGDYFKDEAAAAYKKPLFTKISVAYAVDRLFSVFAITVVLLTLGGYLTDTQEYGESAYFVCAFAVIGSYAFAKKTACKATVITSVIALISAVVCIYSANYALVLFTCVATGFAAGTGAHNDSESMPWDFLVSALSMFAGAIVSYYVIHEMSEVMKFSSNRIVYLVQSNLFIPVVVAFAAKVLCHILNVATNAFYPGRRTNTEN